MQHSSIFTNIYPCTDFNKVRHLLLLADPSIEQLNKYLPNSSIYELRYKEKVIGVVVLKKLNEIQIEIKNIAVSNEFQQLGFGKKLLLFSINHANENEFKELVIRTGNSSINQLAIYQKIGFNITNIEYDYFTKKYKDLIIENQIQCRHQITLTYKL